MKNWKKKYEDLRINIRILFRGDTQSLVDGVYNSKTKEKQVEGLSAA